MSKSETFGRKKETHPGPDFQSDENRSEGVRDLTKRSFLIKEQFSLALDALFSISQLCLKNEQCNNGKYILLPKLLFHCLPNVLTAN